MLLGTVVFEIVRANIKYSENRFIRSRVILSAWTDGRTKRISGAMNALCKTYIRWPATRSSAIPYNFNEGRIVLRMYLVLVYLTTFSAVQIMGPVGWNDSDE
jgi:hypothetical protein